MKTGSGLFYFIKGQVKSFHTKRDESRVLCSLNFAL